MFVACQWPNHSILGSMDQIKLEIYQKCVVHKRSSGLDLPRGKKTLRSGTLPSRLMLNGQRRFQVVVGDGGWSQWNQCQWNHAMDQANGTMQAPIPPPPPESSEPLKLGIVLAHLAAAIVPLIFSPTSTARK